MYLYVCVCVCVCVCDAQVKESQQVKLVFSEQLSKLQNKQHQDTELLEEISRSVTLMCVFSSVFAVWRSVVDATAQTAASRLDAAEKYRSLSGRASRSVRNEKDVRVKRGLEQLQAVQAEVLDALRELQQLKKNYHQLSHIASVARSKAADVQSRSNEHGIFHFKTGLHRTTAKLAARLKECEDGLTEARNHFLLTLAAVNAHHQFYYTEDLPHVLEVRTHTHTHTHTH
uniref:Uncharacterized protein n=1 Tax=Cynoglossus semilaevis TaxID=244447 RepID=A0A3P8X3Y3_CYNSE